MAPKSKFELKTPKGTKDWFGKDMIIREKIFSQLKDVFQKHGGMELDTPVFELKEILSGKYGEDSKLIYDLADQGGEITSLRYDLTVPFARWLAMNKDIQSVKRYHISKVYRRDQPAMNKGRMREFYQCDFDIAGTYDSMLPDAEIIRIVVEVFEGLGWNGNYTIKLNHRKILDGIFEVCGVPEDKIRTISSAVDKLDKLPWADVRKEMTEEKGLDGEVADKIGEWVVLKGKQDLLRKLQRDDKLSANASMKAGMSDLEMLFNYLEAFGALDRVSFDLSLARGLDYYTGVIYEVVTEGSAPAATPGADDTTVKSKKKSKSKDKDDEDRSDDPSVGVGSVAAGGRYDNLVGMFSGKTQIPCVGVSFGIERIFSITKARMQAESEAPQSTVDVFVMSLGSKAGLIKERLEVCSKLWDAGIKAEFLYKVKPKLPNQFKAAEANATPFAVILGDEEVQKGVVKIKELGLPEGHPQKDGELVDMAALVPEVQKRLQRKRELDNLARGAEGLRVVGGLKGEAVKSASASEVGTTVEKPAEAVAEEAKPEEAKPEEAKPAEAESTEEKPAPSA
ncbi:Histidine--tRNA ligase [Colletotrichum sp. SAR 10_86]|nr:Histidine--tRNA ligase [Colletotrichum sp. SAR 10_75]KAI8206396.1 Histidine--tRNA ligase [Colletotrichum sp. SAR 10_76]KAI8226170.1 Histidine--tRNA ligase [Colletotrichum sp. SAR 10_86]KAI8247083.1 Histidine--tRNA ligase [Colletotrichum sp. SAR 10_77]KAJ5006579.1 Histidine--tRNA ligase [Colletotrichum sp. SAR 10_66]